MTTTPSPNTRDKNNNNNNMKMAQPMPNTTSKSKNLEETESPLQQPQKLEPLSASLQPATTPNASMTQPYLISLHDILGHIGANQMYKNGIYVSCIKEMVSQSWCFYSHSTRVFGLVGTGTIATTTNNNITIINQGQVAGGHGHWSGNRSPYGMVIAAIHHGKPSNSNNNKRGMTTAILT